MSSVLLLFYLGAKVLQTRLNFFVFSDNNGIWLLTKTLLKRSEVGRIINTASLGCLRILLQTTEAECFVTGKKRLSIEPKNCRSIVGQPFELSMWLTIIFTPCLFNWTACVPSYSSGCALDCFILFLTSSIVLHCTDFYGFKAFSKSKFCFSFEKCRRLIWRI